MLHSKSDRYTELVKYTTIPLGLSHKPYLTFDLYGLPNPTSRVNRNILYA
ncbi:MAG: hypothetical protein RMY29_012040 [Nostoc sp. CreGUA01]|nr:hypothetical protein [Nostoc sp. CreGUA01]